MKVRGYVCIIVLSWVDWFERCSPPPFFFFVTPWWELWKLTFPTPKNFLIGFCDRNFFVSENFWYFLNFFFVHIPWDFEICWRGGTCKLQKLLEFLCQIEIVSDGRKSHWDCSKVIPESWIWFFVWFLRFFVVGTFTTFFVLAEFRFFAFSLSRIHSFLNCRVFELSRRVDEILLFLQTFTIDLSWSVTTGVLTTRNL